MKKEFNLKKTCEILDEYQKKNPIVKLGMVFGKLASRYHGDELLAEAIEMLKELLSVYGDTADALHFLLKEKESKGEENEQ
jgi:hypothetical protein